MCGENVDPICCLYIRSANVDSLWIQSRQPIAKLGKLLSASLVANVVDKGLEGLMTEKCLDQVAVAFVLCHQVCVLRAEVVAFLCLHGNFAFKLRDVFCERLVMV